MLIYLTPDSLMLHGMRTESCPWIKRWLCEGRRRRLTNVPDVWVQAHVIVGGLELQTGVSSRQLPAAIWVPWKTCYRALHLVRVSMETRRGQGHRSLIHSHRRPLNARGVVIFWLTLCWAHTWRCWWFWQTAARRWPPPRPPHCSTPGKCPRRCSAGYSVPWPGTNTPSSQQD